MASQGNAESERDGEPSKILTNVSLMIDVNNMVCSV